MCHRGNPYLPTKWFSNNRSSKNADKQGKSAPEPKRRKEDSVTVKTISSNAIGLDSCFLFIDGNDSSSMY